MIDYPSDNFDDRPPGARIKYLIYHYTEGSLEESLEWLTTTNPTGGKVSAHYLICDEGQVYSLVPESKRAWHAGISAWEDDVSLNNTSIGIELVNSGNKAYPLVQMDALALLTHQILARHTISPFHILGHSDIAPERKMDPGAYFDWKWLAERGIGIYPYHLSALKEPSIYDLQAQLKTYGYKVALTGALDSQTECVLNAFQLHFGCADLASISSKLHWLLKQKISNVAKRCFS